MSRGTVSRDWFKGIEHIFHRIGSFVRIFSHNSFSRVDILIQTFFSRVDILIQTFFSRVEDIFRRPGSDLLSICLALLVQWC